VYAVVGNNDSYQDNYVSDPKGRFFKEMTEVWAGLIMNADHKAAMQKSFIQGGYYAVDLSKAMRLIVLNTNFFSYKARGNSIQEAAVEELNWLHRQLLEATQRNQKILIALHIPESIVVSVLGVPLFRLMELWKRPYQQQFEAELTLFSGQISGILAGHLHRNWQQTLNLKGAVASIPLSGTLSVSPILGNDPGFKLYDYSNNTYQLERAITYYRPLMDGQWHTKVSIFH
jgi:hypothetical protein